MVGADFAKEKRRVNVGKVNLAGTFEVAFGVGEVLRHDVEIDVLRAKNVANLSQHFLDAHIAAGVARTVVTGKEQLQFFTRRPALAEAKHPSETGNLNQGANPGDKEKIGHARALSATAFLPAPELEGQGLAGNWNLFSRQYFRSGAA